MGARVEVTKRLRQAYRGASKKEKAGCWIVFASLRDCPGLPRGGI